jgi:hypothetical protein
MALVLSVRPFSKLLERNGRTLAICLEQVEHRLRLLEPQFRGMVDGGICQHGTPRAFEARTRATNSKVRQAHLISC